MYTFRSVREYGEASSQGFLLGEGAVTHMRVICLGETTFIWIGCEEELHTYNTV